MLEFPMPLLDSRELCIAAKNHCSSAIHLMLQRPNSNLMLLTPSMLALSSHSSSACASSPSSMLPIEYALQSAIIHRQSSQSLATEQETLWCYRSREHIAHEVISLLAQQTVRAIQKLFNQPEHTLITQNALTRLLRLENFLFEDITTNTRALLESCSDNITACAVLSEVAASPVFTTLYEGIKQDSISALIVEDHDQLAKAPNSPKPTP